MNESFENKMNIHILQLKVLKLTVYSKEKRSRLGTIFFTIEQPVKKIGC